MNGMIIELFPGSKSNDLPEPRNDVERAYAARVAELETKVQSLEGTFDVIEGVCRRSRSTHPSLLADEG